MPTTALLGALALALALAACGTTKIDTTGTERFIERTVSRRAGVRVASVGCPREVTAKRGDTFTCTVTGTDGSTGKAVVRELDDEGRLRTDVPFLHPRELERSITGDLRARLGATIRLRCPEVVVGRRGATFDCRARSGAQSRTVRVTQRNAAGSVRYALR